MSSASSICISAALFCFILLLFGASKVFGLQQYIESGLGKQSEKGKQKRGEGGSRYEIQRKEKRHLEEEGEIEGGEKQMEKGQSKRARVCQTKEIEQKANLSQKKKKSRETEKHQKSVREDKRQKTEGRTSKKEKVEKSEQDGREYWKRKFQQMAEMNVKKGPPSQLEG